MVSRKTKSDLLTEIDSLKRDKSSYKQMFFCVFVICLLLGYHFITDYKDFQIPSNESKKQEISNTYYGCNWISETKEIIQKNNCTLLSISINGELQCLTKDCISNDFCKLRIVKLEN